MIKILHISTSLKGGAGKAAFRLHLALSEESSISSYFLQRENSNINDEKIGVVPLKKHTFLKRAFNYLGYPILYWHKNNKIINQFKGKYEQISFPENDAKVEEHPWIKEADIIHLHWVSNFINFPTFFEAIKNKPVVWTLHDMNPFMGLFHYQIDEDNNIHKFNKVDQGIRSIKKYCIHKVKSLNVVCPSKWLCYLAQNSQIFKSRNCSVIPYSLPLKWFELKDKLNSKKYFNLNPDKITLLFIALDIDIQRKGFSLLERALKLIPQENIQLLVIGNSKLKFSAPNIIITGALNEEEMMMAYAASDVFILPSLEDNLPNVMLESFAQGTPVISFKNGGMKDWIKNGINGYLCEEISAECLNKTILLFLKEKEEFDRIKINIFAVDNFHPALQANAYEKLYKEILSLG